MEKYRQRIRNGGLKSPRRHFINQENRPPRMLNYTTTNYNIINHQPFGNDMEGFMKHQYHEEEYYKEQTIKNLKYYTTRGEKEQHGSMGRMMMHKERIQQKRRQEKAQNWVVEFQNENYKGKTKPTLKNHEHYQIEKQRRKVKQNMMSDKDKTPLQPKRTRQKINQMADERQQHKQLQQQQQPSPYIEQQQQQMSPDTNSPYIEQQQQQQVSPMYPQSMTRHLTMQQQQQHMQQMQQQQQPHMQQQRMPLNFDQYTSPQNSPMNQQLSPYQLSPPENYPNFQPQQQQHSPNFQPQPLQQRFYPR